MLRDCNVALHKALAMLLRSICCRQLVANIVDNLIKSLCIIININSTLDALPLATVHAQREVQRKALTCNIQVQRQHFDTQHVLETSLAT